MCGVVCVVWKCGWGGCKCGWGGCKCEGVGVRESVCDVGRGNIAI